MGHRWRGHGTVWQYGIIHPRASVVRRVFAMYVIRISVVPINMWSTHCSHGILTGRIYP